MTTILSAASGAEPITPAGRQEYGYLLIHFVENRHGHTEKIYFSLSDGNNPLKWRRLNNGEPVLEWANGSTGVRDPYIVAGADGYHIIATDLRVWRADGSEPDWEQFGTYGSHDLIVWDSPDLVHWSQPRAVTVAPKEAGMAWAPEALWDPIAGDYLVYWSSRLNGGPARIMVARTTDFKTFTPAEVYLSLGDNPVIDMTATIIDGRVHRFAKQDESTPDSMRVFQQVGSSFFADDFATVATGLGAELGGGQEAPLIFREHHSDRWYLWVDRYGEDGVHGYRALTSTDPASGNWRLLADGELELPPNTKHGVVLPLLAHQYEAIENHY